ncbi:MAG: SRPBCC domain-containing protein [Brevundimonas sp.]|uniref:SRPBCC domain-containing protein n=1 Tax=Brevundimonas sp. TaxID=1871086 RepID=UPI000DB71001|nr:SRPBCC domain-containing protein [Brevundimonas sp.]PZT96891.1 MAG: SRPBCC domain-containing protein [Brevundimonas sp.]
MDDTRIEKRIGVRATSDRIWDLVADLPGWRRWNPVDAEVEGVIAFGGRLTMTEAWPEMPPRQSLAQVAEWQPRVRLVWAEKRGFLFQSLRYIEIEELAPSNCILAIGVRFSGLRGELFHDKHRPAIRKAHEAMAEGLKTAAEAG